MKKVVIIGGMAAGCKAAARLKRLKPHYQVTIIEKTPIPIVRIMWYAILRFR